MRKGRPLLSILLPAVLAASLLLVACRDGGAPPRTNSVPARTPSVPWVVTVDSLADGAPAADGATTLREALEQVPSGGTVTFAPSLSGGTIALSVTATDNTRLRGEAFTPGPPVFLGFQERNYGASALFSEKDVTIDASSLPGGITLRWTGGTASPARVLAVRGNLALYNVTIRDGFSRAALVDEGSQKYTLARGGAVACWGQLTLSGCTLYGNRALGDLEPARDRGAFGGAVYGDAVELDNCVVAGNRAEGYGAAGGGVYAVGGRESGYESLYRNSSVTGNRVTAQHAYGGGIYSDGGGRAFGDQSWLNPVTLRNCTVARNVVEDEPAVAEDSRSQYYYRGGGVYMSNGCLEMQGCTVAENRVTGVPAVFNGKPNLAGGGVAATVGNAHDVEYMAVWHSVLAGNTADGAPSDLFTGSLVNFYSYGYNVLGTIDFGQILVPEPNWYLSRKHYPKVGDRDGVPLSEALSLPDARLHPDAVSAGTDNGAKALLWYLPGAASRDRVSPVAYSVSWIDAYCYRTDDNTDALLAAVLRKLDTDYAASLGPAFSGRLPVTSGIPFDPAPYTWPSDNASAPWIAFWRSVDNAIGTQLGPEKLADDFWGSFRSGDLEDGSTLFVDTYTSPMVALGDADQRGGLRPAGVLGDAGAVEALPGEAGADPPPSGGGGGGGGCSVSPGGNGRAPSRGGDALLVLAAAAFLARRRWRRGTGAGRSKEAPGRPGGAA